MMKQSLDNHTRIAKGFYLATGVPTLLLLAMAIRQFFLDAISVWEVGLMFLLTAWILLTYLYRVRYFALKAQDRAIRAEETLRYFMLTGKRIDPRITLSQVIALRFASDEELPSLVQLAAEKGLTNKEIKQQIRHWRADWHRV